MGFSNRGKIGKEFCGGEIRNFEDEFNGGGIWNLEGGAAIRNKIVELEILLWWD